MTRYDKGSFYERQLKAMLEQKGFFVVRAAGSGVAGDAPDLIVLRSGKKFGVECKAWKESLFLDKPTVVAYREWEKTTGMPVYLAWKKPRKEWRFFSMVALRETKRGFAVGEKDYEAGMFFEDLLK
jgi:Holliday junction resolvase